jgi:glycosyltransferase involved in cell wall biosynthesis
MKIGIDIRNIGKKRTGDEEVFFNLVKNLAAIDGKNEYWLFTNIGDTSILRNMEVELGIAGRPNFKIVSLFNSLFKKKKEIAEGKKAGFFEKFFNNKFVWNSWTLPKYLRQNPVDIYHTQYITPFFVPRKIKIITTIHDISFNFFPRLIKFSDLLFLKTLIPLSLRRADKVIAVSHFTKNEIVKHYKTSPEKIEVAPNAASDSFSRKIFSSEELEKARKKYALPEKFILYLGTLQPRKNIPFLIKGYGKIRDKIPSVKLVIAGRKGHNFDKRISMVIKKHRLENDVIFPGFIDEKDKPMLFSLASTFVFPSLYEGFGIPLLEAMGQGIPVLCSDIPSFREVGGKAAVYFNPLALDDLAGKLYNVFVDQKLRQNLIEKSKQQLKLFSWAKSAEKLIRVYENLK